MWSSVYHYWGWRKPGRTCIRVSTLEFQLLIMCTVTPSLEIHYLPIFIAFEGYIYIYIYIYSEQIGGSK
jgi:hypothetical protein